MLRAIVFVTSFAVLLSIFTNCVECSEIRFISPIGAATRSIIPGWGQVYTSQKLQGAVAFLAVGILFGGAVQANATSRNIYNDKYVPAFLADSSQADFHFDRANQYHKLSRFLLYAGAGIWGYSIIDAYIDAHVHNARLQVRMLDIDDGGIQQLRLEARADGVETDPLFPLRTGAVSVPRTAIHKDHP